MFGIFKNQLIEIIEWKETDRDTIMWKFIDHGNDSNIKYGAQLVVRESQVALFVNEGQIADVYLPGRHVLKTENMPILTALKSWKHGFESPFKVDVYFMSTRQFTDLKWGTPNPIFINDPEVGGRIAVRAFGSYFIRIGDPKLFFREYAGTKNTITIDELGDSLRGVVVPKFGEAVMRSQVGAFEIQGNYTALGDKVQPMLQQDLQPFGIELTKFQITSVSLPPEVEAHMNEITKGRMMKGDDLQKLSELSRMRSMEKSAEKGNYENFQMGQMSMMQQQMMMQMMQNQMMNQNNNQNQNQQNQNQNQNNNQMSRDEVMKALKDLGELKQMGVLTDAEFEEKKKELLAKL